MKKQYIFWITAVLIIGMLFSGCNGMLMEAVEASAEKTGLVEPTKQMLTGLLQDDFDTCLSLLPDQITQTDFRPVFDQLRQLLAQVDTYTLTPTNVNVRTSNGVTFHQVRFLMESGELMFYVDVASSSEVMGFTSFHVTPHVPVTMTGTLLTLKGANPVQWIFLLIAALEMAFVIWMVVDCARRKMQNKVIWLLVILLGNLLNSITWTDGSINFNFNVGIILSYTALIRYSTGEFMLRLLLPIGAIVYFAVRKSLKPKPVKNVPQQYDYQNPAQQAAPYGQEIPEENALSPEEQKQE